MNDLIYIIDSNTKQAILLTLFKECRYCIEKGLIIRIWDLTF